MKKLAVMPDSPAAYELLRRLEDASIKASVSRNDPTADLYVGAPPQVIIWISDASDAILALKIFRELESQQTNGVCPGCGYDLRGHSGKARCPECGQPIMAPIADRVCPHCGEIVPANFEICWNCQREINL